MVNVSSKWTYSTTVQCRKYTLSFDVYDHHAGVWCTYPGDCNAIHMTLVACAAIDAWLRFGFVPTHAAIYLESGSVCYDRYLFPLYNMNYNQHIQSAIRECLSMGRLVNCALIDVYMEDPLMHTIHCDIDRLLSEHGDNSQTWSKHTHGAYDTALCVTPKSRLAVIINCFELLCSRSFVLGLSTARDAYPKMFKLLSIAAASVANDWLPNVTSLDYATRSDHLIVATATMLMLADGVAFDRGIADSVVDNINSNPNAYYEGLGYLCHVVELASCLVSLSPRPLVSLPPRPFVHLTHPPDASTRQVTNG